MVFKLASHLIHRRFHAANPLLAKKITESLSWIRRLKEGSGQFCKHPSDQTFVLQDGSDQSLQEERGASQLQPRWFV